MISPELRVYGVGNQARRRLEVLDRGEQSGFAELARERWSRFNLGGLHQAVNLPADPIDKENFSGLVLAKANDAVRSDSQLMVFGNLTAVVAERPDTTGIEIAVDAGALQLLQALAVIDVTAGQGAKVGVRVLDDGFHYGIGPEFALGPERVCPLQD